MRRIAWIAMVLLALGGCVLTGCAQHTEVPGDQRMAQESVTPTATEQDAATQGSHVNIFVINAPGKTQIPKPGDPGEPGDDGIAGLLGDLTSGDGPDVELSRAGFAQNGIHITVNTGSTAADQAGTTTATASTAQTPSMTQAASPTQRVEPDIGISVPVAVAPGGIIDQASAATGGGGTTSLEKTSANDLKWARLQAAAEAIPGLLDRLLEYVGGLAATQPE